MDTSETLRADLRCSRSSGSGDGYPPALRERVGRWVLAQQATGARLSALAQQVGVSATSLRVWARAVDGCPGARPAEFLPVVVRSGAGAAAPAGGPELHTPQGYRVSGLGLDELVAVLRRLE